MLATHFLRIFPGTLIVTEPADGPPAVNREDFMSITALALLFAIGAFAGTLTSTLGLGASLVVVPSLLFALPVLGVPAAVTPVVALGTALTVSLFTALFTAYLHAKLGNLERPFSSLNLSLMMCAGFGAVGGSLVASSIPAPAALSVMAAAQVVLGAMLLLRRRDARASSQPASASLAAARHIVSRDEEFMPILATAGGPNPPAVSEAATDAPPLGRRSMPVFSAIGFLTSMGAGGSLIAPYLAISGLEHRKAVGLAGLLSVLIGACAFTVYASQTLPEQVSGALGAVHLPAVALICLGSFFAARLGAAWATRVNQDLLRRVLGFGLLASAVRICVLLIA